MMKRKTMYSNEILGHTNPGNGICLTTNIKLVSFTNTDSGIVEMEFLE